MKLHQARVGDRNQFTAYGSGYVAVNQQRYERAIVVTPEAVHDTWPVVSLEALNAGAMRFLLDFQPEILLLGTGAIQRFPPPEVLREFVMARIGVEVMDTPAACRTYNILMAEGRNVIAAILL